jgi:hypothetical protein
MDKNGNDSWNIWLELFLGISMYRDQEELLDEEPRDKKCHKIVMSSEKLYNIYRFSAMKYQRWRCSCN